MKQQTTWNKFLIIVLVLVMLVLLRLLSPILTPFLVGALLAYLSDPLVTKLMRLHLPRTLSVIIVFSILFAAMILLVLLLIPLIQKQIIILTDVIPKAVIKIQVIILPWLNEHAGAVAESFDISSLKATLMGNWKEASNIAAWVWDAVLKSGSTLFEWLINLVLIPVVTFYLLRDWKTVVSGLDSLLPRKIEKTVAGLVAECDLVLSAFFRGQLLVMLALGVYYSIALSVIGLQLGLIIGLIVGLVSIVPYLGLIIGISAAIIAAFVQFGTLTSVLLVCLVFVIGQVLESVFLTPKLVGDRIGLHPVAVIFAVLAGGALFGFFGVLLALPAAAVIMVLIRYLVQRYHDSRLYQS